MNSSADEGVDLLKKLVNISSGSTNIEGVNEVQKVVSEELEKIGFKIENISYPQNKLGQLIVGTIKGKDPSFITFIIHADTVFEKSSGFEGYRISEDGLKAFGPGVIDDKGGIVVLLNGLKDFLKDNPEIKYSLRVISSPGEEVGTPKFLTAYKAYSKDSRLVLGFEPCLEDGSIIDSRRGNIWYQIKVVGREAHAGRSHKTGINACWDLAKKLDKVSQLTDYKKDITVSIGHIEGGKDKFNVVCGEASAKIDVRFSKIEDQEQIHKKIMNLLNTSYVSSQSDSKPTETFIEIVDNVSPFSASSEAVEKINEIRKSIKKYENLEVHSMQSGGSADSNNFARPGLPIIDGLGACGGKMHTNEEFIILSSLKTRSEVLIDLLKKNLK